MEGFQPDAGVASSLGDPAVLEEMRQSIFKEMLSGVFGRSGSQAQGAGSSSDPPKGASKGKTKQKGGQDDQQEDLSSMSVREKAAYKIVQQIESGQQISGNSKIARLAVVLDEKLKGLDAILEANSEETGLRYEGPFDATEFRRLS